jgi:predicted amidohydrolase
MTSLRLTPRLRLALAQYPIERLRSLEDFEVKLDDILTAAKEDAADLLVLPEYAVMELAAAFTAEADAVAERDAIVERADVIVEVMREGARRHGLWLLGGSVPMLRDGVVRNRAPLISAQGRLAFQEKRVMTRFETEQWQVSSGEEPSVFDTPWGRIGIAIC